VGLGEHRVTVPLEPSVVPRGVNLIAAAEKGRLATEERLKAFLENVLWQSMLLGSLENR